MSVRPSVRPSVGPSVGPYVPRYFQTRTRRILCRVSGLVHLLLDVETLMNIQNDDCRRKGECFGSSKDTLMTEKGEK